MSCRISAYICRRLSGVRAQAEFFALGSGLDLHQLDLFDILKFFDDALDAQNFAGFDEGENFGEFGLRREVNRRHVA